MSQFVSECWQLFSEMPLAILAAVSIWLGVYLLNALSFWCVLPRVPARSVFSAVVAGYALNYITPFGLLGGEPYRIWYLKRYMPASQAAWSVGLYASMHIASHFVFWLLALVVGFDVFPEDTVTLPLVLTGVAVLGVTLWLSYRRRVSVRMSFMSLVTEFLSRLFAVLEYWVFMSAVGIGDATFTSAFLVVAISSLVANILFFSPLQAGTREAGITLALALLYGGGLSATTDPHYIALGVTISLATRIREGLWIIVGLLLSSATGWNKLGRGR